MRKLPSEANFLHSEVGQPVAPRDAQPVLYWLRVEGGQLPQRACNHMCWRLQRYVWEAAVTCAMIETVHSSRPLHICSSCRSDSHTYYTCYAYTCYAYTCYAYN